MENRDEVLVEVNLMRHTGNEFRALGCEEEAVSWYNRADQYAMAHQRAELVSGIHQGPGEHVRVGEVPS